MSMMMLRSNFTLALFALALVEGCGEDGSAIGGEMGTSGDDAVCPVGVAGCPCTINGACEPGLACFAGAGGGVCIPADDDGNPGQGDGTGTSADATGGASTVTDPGEASVGDGSSGDATDGGTNDGLTDTSVSDDLDEGTARCVEMALYEYERCPSACAKDYPNVNCGGNLAYFCNAKCDVTLYETFDECYEKPFNACLIAASSEYQSCLNDLDNPEEMQCNAYFVSCRYTYNGMMDACHFADWDDPVPVPADCTEVQECKNDFSSVHMVEDAQCQTLDDPCEVELCRGSLNVQLYRNHLGCETDGCGWRKGWYGCSYKCNEEFTNCREAASCEAGTDCVEPKQACIQDCNERFHWQ